jgi:hypothetical protein
MTNANEPTSVTAIYFDSWRQGDLATLRSVLADDVDFLGPLAQINGADACVAGMQGLIQATTDIVICKVFADGPDVLTWFDLHTPVAPPCPVANWSHVDGGQIDRIRVVFDPRPLLRE